MAVLGAFHRRGIGTQLVEVLNAWTFEHDVGRVELTVMSHNHAAVALSRRSGFVQEGVKRGVMLIDGHLVDEIVMAKTVGRPMGVSTWAAARPHTRDLAPSAAAARDLECPHRREFVSEFVERHKTTESHRQRRELRCGSE